MGKIRKLSDLTTMEFAFKSKRPEEHVSFIDLDTDTSSLDSRSDESSSSGDCEFFSLS
jgi:hypothetical protein